MPSPTSVLAVVRVILTMRKSVIKGYTCALAYCYHSVKYNYEIKAKAMALQVATKRAALCVRLSEKAVAHAGATGDAIAVKEW